MYLDGVLMPVTPSQVKVKINNQNKTMTLIGGEEINLLKSPSLSDISFSSNDIALNTLLSILPSKIEIHIIDKEDEFINTLKLIFEDRVRVCNDCNICRTYRKINDMKIIK